MKFTIPGKLPGYNELTKGHHMTRYRIKHEAMETVMWCAKGIKPVERCEIRITCFEPNKRRDPSNVRAGAEKVILDALQNMGIIRNDNWQWLEDCPAVVKYDPENQRIEIEVRSV